ncbi:MAG: terminase small subunit [Bryobacteraceae bacterium]
MLTMGAGAWMIGAWRIEGKRLLGSMQQTPETAMTQRKRGWIKGSGGDAPLCVRARKFAAEYLIDLNATRAAVRAGYSARTAKGQGSRLLGDKRVQEIIEAGTREMVRGAGLRAEDVLNRIAAIALGDIGEVVSWDRNGVMTVRPSDELTASQRALIRTIRFTTRVNKNGDVVHHVNVEPVDQTPYVQMLGRYFGFLKDGAAVNNTQNNLIIADAATARGILERLGGMMPVDRDALLVEAEEVVA